MAFFVFCFFSLNKLLFYIYYCYHYIIKFYAYLYRIVYLLRVYRVSMILQCIYILNPQDALCYAIKTFHFEKQNSVFIYWTSKELHVMQLRRFILNHSKTVYEPTRCLLNVIQSRRFILNSNTVCLYI